VVGLPVTLVDPIAGYVFNVVVLSREAFDAIEFDAACSGEHRAAAQEMTWLADTGTQTVSMPRSEAYVRAGEQWLLADDPAAAVHRFHRALADGGPSSVDPRIPLARALFQLGRNAEAEAHIGGLGSEPPRDARMCDLLAELLVEQSDLPGALAWATAGVELCLGLTPGPVAGTLGSAAQDGTAKGSAGPDGASSNSASPSTAAPGGTAGPVLANTDVLGGHADENELRLLLSLRFRIRNDLGLPDDDYDRLLDDPRLRHTSG
jgi:Tetratricopeptide repeat